MKQVSNIVLGILTVAVAVLFYLQFSRKQPTGGGSPAISITDVKSAEAPFKIAYFEMDSVEQQYQYIKEVQGLLKKKEQSITSELGSMRSGYANRVQQLQAQAPQMSQQDGERAQAEITQMERNLQQREAKLAQELQEQQFKLMQDINKKIEDFLTEYNKTKGYSYIFSRQSGDFIYFKDTTLNITNDLIKGLNEQYYKEKNPKKDSKKE
jgi:outer membrane protein